MEYVSHRNTNISMQENVLGNAHLDRPGARFTKDISHGIQIRWKFYFALT